jgi:ADP-heptose:LPS heptosyltransferase
MHGGGRWSNPLVRRLGARTTAGCRAEDAEPLDRWIRYVYFQPEIMRQLEVAGLLGAVPVTVEPAIAVTERDRDEAAAFTERGAFAVLHPGATSLRRRWPAGRFAQIGDALVQRGLRVVVTGTGPERTLVDDVRAAMRSPAEDGCAALSLGGLAALLARATLLVSNDTGPLHLANAVGARTVGIFWIGNLVNGAPLGRARHRPIPSFRTHCPCCGVLNVTEHCGHEVCFVDDVEVETVRTAALDLLDAAVSPAPAASPR